MFKVFFLIISLSITSYGKTLFIEGIDNKFLCDGKQSSGGGFQKCGKITALKPMTLCFSTPSGVKCKKLEANETLDTEINTTITNNKNENKASKDILKQKNRPEMSSKNSLNNIRVKSETNLPEEKRTTENTPPVVDNTPTPPVDNTPTPPVDNTPTPPVDNTPTPSVDNTPTPPVDTPIEISFIDLFNLDGVNSSELGSSLDKDKYRIYAPFSMYKIKFEESVSSGGFSTGKYYINKSLLELSNSQISSKGYSSNENLEYIITDNPYMINDMSWGHWAEPKTPGNPYNPNIFSYVGGIKTDSSIISELLKFNENQTFTFNGKVIGNVLTSNNILENITMDNTNSLQMVFDLGGGTNSMAGTMSFSSPSTSWDLSLNSNHTQISNEGFSGSISSNKSSVKPGHFEGQFYGEDKLRGVGGTFNMNDISGNKAIGAFKAFRDDIDTKTKNLERQNGGSSGFGGNAPLF